MKTTEQQIEVMAAFLKGAVIQYRPHRRDDWNDASSPLWDWAHKEYRVKPAAPVTLYAAEVYYKGNEKRYFISEDEATSLATVTNYGDTKYRWKNRSIKLVEVVE